jgi:hypothetical protein
MAFTGDKSAGEIALEKVEHFYDEHKMGVNLCLLGIAAGLGAAKAVVSLAARNEPIVAEAGTIEFDALQDTARFAVNDAPRPLTWKAKFGDAVVFAAPSRARGASEWAISVPDQLHSSEGIANGSGEMNVVQGYNDVKLTRSFDYFQIERPSFGTVILKKSDSTGRFIDPNGKLRLVLNPLGDEIQYGEDGSIQSITRNNNRTLDVMKYYG